VLTENERTLVWTKAYEADVRSLYFGDQAVRYTKHKQIITGVSFFLSSGAAAALIASAPKFIPTILAVIVAVLTAYSMAVGLDRRIGTVCKLHSEWNHLGTEYESLWDHWYDDRAQENLTGLLKRGRDASQIAIEMPYDAEAMEKWEMIVSARLKGESA
jgi:hypothetical protein